MTRIEFLCGVRALADYRLAHKTALGVARLFSAERDSSPGLVSQALQENKSLHRRVHELLELAMSAEASDRLANAAARGDFKIVQAIFDGRDVDEIRMLAAKIVQLEPSVALLATRNAEGARMVFARSASLAENMGELLAEACAALGGRGGGKPDLAQGGGPDVDRVEDAIRVAFNKMTSLHTEAH